MNWINRKKTGDILLLANLVVFLLLINAINSLFFRIDLTEEGRYTIKPQTKELLHNLDEEIFIEVFLEGDLNPSFRRFRNSIRETLEEFRVYSDNKVNYIFTDPSQAQGEKARNEFMNELASKGVVPTNVIETKDGQRIEKFVFPGAIVSMGGLETAVMLLKGARAQGSQEAINQSIEGIEYELANSIYKLTNESRKRIGLVRGHQEVDSLAIASFNNALLEQYDVFKTDISATSRINSYDALIIAKPKIEFTPQEKFKLDQYIMQGGKVLFLIDRLDASMDSASRDNYFAFPYNLGLDDQLFKYGVRINPDLIEDRVSGKYPVVVGKMANRPQIMQLDWPFFPLINRYAEHPITRNLDATLCKFISSIDTVKAIGVKKIPLLFTSPYTRKISSPVKVGVDDLRKQLQEGKFESGVFPIGYLLEGKFTSLYKNRFAPEGADTSGFRSSSVPTKLIVVADGDIIRNEVNPREGKPLALGMDPITNYTFANQDLLLNMVAYLTDEGGLIMTRNKDIKIRPLDKKKVVDERTYWQVINIVIPLILLVAFGVMKAYLRKLKYSKF